MVELFGVDVRTVNEHLKNIFLSAELTENATIRKIRIVQKEGNREVGREVDFYSLDAILAVGYRVNSYQATQFKIGIHLLNNLGVNSYHATQFKIWATKTLKEVFTRVQNKLHWAITGKTAAEIIYASADTTKRQNG